MENITRGRQLTILMWLVVLLCAVIVWPTLSLGLHQLLPRAPVRLGVAEVSIPKTWMLRQDPHGGVRAWKPCHTIFCESSDASFVLEVRDLPYDVWEHAATKILHDSYSAEVINRTIQGDSGLVKCVELKSAPGDGRVVASCINSDLHLTSTFTGKPSLERSFYSVFASAHKGF